MDATRSDVPAFPPDSGHAPTLPAHDWVMAAIALLRAFLSTLTQPISPVCIRCLICGSSISDPALDARALLHAEGCPVAALHRALDQFAPLYRTLARAGLPTAADLDAVAAEQSIAAATSGAVDQPDGAADGDDPRIALAESLLPSLQDDLLSVHVDDSGRLVQTFRSANPVVDQADGSAHNVRVEGSVVRGHASLKPDRSITNPAPRIPNFMGIAGDQSQNGGAQ